MPESDDTARARETIQAGAEYAAAAVLNHEGPMAALAVLVIALSIVGKIGAGDDPQEVETAKQALLELVSMCPCWSMPEDALLETCRQAVANVGEEVAAVLKARGIGAADTGWQGFATSGGTEDVN